MGRVQDPAPNQTEYELQPQEYEHYEAPNELALTLDYDQHQQGDSSNAMANEPFQPPQAAQWPPQYANPQAQPNPAYPPPKTQPVQRLQNPQINAMNAGDQLVPYPPQQSPQQQGLTPVYGYNKAPQPVPFPPANYQNNPVGCPGIPASPHKPPVSGIPIPVPVNTESWKTGLFDCMNDPTNALVTACFPCVTFGQIAEIVDQGHTSCGTGGLLYGLIAFLIAVPCIYSCTYRTKMRNMYGLTESPAPDWIVHCFCECCALCQEYRELQHKGFDPSIGWIGNVQRNQMQPGGMVPPMNQTMMG